MVVDDDDSLDHGPCWEGACGQIGAQEGKMQIKAGWLTRGGKGGAPESFRGGFRVSGCVTMLTFWGD